MLAGGRASGLQDINVCAPHVLHDLDINFAVTELADKCPAHAHTQFGRDFTGQLRVGVAGKQRQVIYCHRVSR